MQKDQKPALRQGDFYTEEQGAAELKKLESMYNNREQWETTETDAKGKHPERDEFVSSSNPYTSECRYQAKSGSMMGTTVQNVVLKPSQDFISAVIFTDHWMTH